MVLELKTRQINVVYIYLQLSQVGVFFFPKKIHALLWLRSAFVCMYETASVCNGSQGHRRAEFLP